VCNLCYLGDMLSVDGDADAAVKGKGSKWMPTSKDISREWETVQQLCAKSYVAWK